MNTAVKTPFDNNIGKFNQFERKAELGWCDLEEGKPGEAGQRFKEGILNGKGSGYRILFNLCMKGLAAAALKRNRLEHAARLYGATEQVSILLGHTALVPGWEAMHQRYFAHLREQLDPQVFERVFQEGRNMGLEEALAYAIET